MTILFTRNIDVYGVTRFYCFFMGAGYVVCIDFTMIKNIVKYLSYIPFGNKTLYKNNTISIKSIKNKFIPAGHYLKVIYSFVFNGWDF